LDSPRGRAVIDISTPPRSLRPGQCDDVDRTGLTCIS
jgi:hypothetical protein